MGGRATRMREGQRFLTLYAELARIHENDLLCKWYPKFHLFQHLLETQIPVAGNPREYWCYEDESNIGHCVQIAESCHPSTLHKLVLRKRQYVIKAVIPVH